MPSGVELGLIQLPGREARLAEAPYSRMGDLLGPMTAALRPHLTGRFAFLGWSMGSLMAFELARRCRAMGLPLPEHLYVAAHRAPHLPFPREPVADKPEPQLKEELKRMGGTPEHLLEHPELMDLLLPVIRADLGLCETYVFQPGPPLPVPVTAYAGAKDFDVPLEHMDLWRQHTAAGFTLRELPGGHFMLHEDPDGFLAALRRDLEALLARR